MSEQPDENLGLAIMRATEAAALIAGRWVGRGDVATADQDAAQAMNAILQTIAMEGRIIIDEEPHRSETALLTSGAAVGLGSGPAMDVVADAIEGVRLLAQGLPDAISVIAMAPRGAMPSFAPARYMEKLVVNARAASAIGPECLDAPAAWTLGVIARALDKQVRDLAVFVLDRSRHQLLIDEIRSAGARVILRPEGDVVGALLAALPNSGVDVLMGVGGITEGVVAACAIKALQGEMLGRLAPQSPTEREETLAAGLDLQRVWSSAELVASDDVFFAATGITDGLLLRGVHYHSVGATTRSLVLHSKTGTRRRVEAEHYWEQLMVISQVAYT
ncbi:MAG: class II fructose-bisphosphatase [Chloroflexales bacterium]|nr:class II fructose-bisphosphatase [Chloroflexales bacterium]